MSLQHVSLQVVELLIAQTAYLFSAAGLENLVGHSQVLVQVCDFLPALWTSVSLFKMDKLDMTIMVRLLVCLVFTLIARVFVRCRRSSF